MAGKKTGRTNKPGAGRPEKPIDFRMLGEMCEIQCTESEIAACFGITIDTLRLKCEKELGINFREFHKAKSEAGNMCLRRAQRRVAIEEGNPAMLIWLGKQKLGQKDTQYLNHSGEVLVRRIKKRFDGTKPEPEQTDEIDDHK